MTQMQLCLDHWQEVVEEEHQAVVEVAHQKVEVEVEVDPQQEVVVETPPHL
jgi:hypothetical protein